MSAKKNIEAIYPMTAMQRATLFHSLAASGRDSGTMQVRAELNGPLEFERLKEAWRMVAKRQPMLRASAHWEKVKQPVIVIHRETEMTWTKVEGGAAAFGDWLKDDAAKGLDLPKAPAMRGAIFSESATSHTFIWTCHHLMLDGWSTAIVLRELVAVHNTLTEGKTPSSISLSSSLKEHFQFLTTGDSGKAKSFWQTRLNDFTEPTLVRPSSGSDAGEMREESLKLDEAFIKKLNSLGVPLNACAQGAWALLLAAATGRDQALFGATVSGRSAGVPNMDSIAGMFTNVIPVPVSIDPEAKTSDWLRGLAKQQIEAQPHEHVPMTQMQDWRPMPNGQPLFDSLIVTQNFLTKPTENPMPGELSLGGFTSGIDSQFPITLAFAPSPNALLHGRYKVDAFDAESMKRLLITLKDALERIADGTDAPLAEIWEWAKTQQIKFAPNPPETQARATDAAEPSALPENDLEFKLLALWKHVLGIATLGVDDDFLDCGGTSLKAVLLFDLVENETGKKLPINTLFEAPTVKALTRLLAAEGWRPSWSPLAPMRTIGTQTPLFCLHSFAGDAFFYLPLLRRLNPDIPLYGLNAPGLDGTREPVTNIGELADLYIAEIKSLQAHGPYRLLGMCFGNVVAYEMAIRMEASADEIAFLGIVDNGPFLNVPPPEKLAKRVLRRLTRTFSPQREGAATKASSDIDNELAEFDPQRRKIAKANIQMRADYVMRPYSGALTLIQSEEFRNGKPWHRKLWKKHVSGPLEFRVIQADHLMLFKPPYVDEFANVLGELLEPAERP